MKKFLNNYKKMILFYSILYILIFLLIKFILNLFGLEYMGWFYNISYIIIVLSIFIGIMQLIIKLNVGKALKIVLTIIYVIIYSVVIMFLIVLLGFMNFFPDEKIVMENNEKMVVNNVRRFMNGTRYYYRYVNFIMKEKECIKKVDY